MSESPKVRMSGDDLDAIKSLFCKYFLADDELWLFGSRVDLARKGGDIDLYVETNASTAKDAIEMRLNFIWDLEQEIGEQKIDVVLNLLKFPHPLSIYDIAKTTGVRLV